MVNPTHKKSQMNSIAVLRREAAIKYLIQGCSYREIRENVMDELGLPSYSLQTVKRDIDKTLDESREMTKATTDQYVQLELKRIDWQLKEAVAGWEKSKEIRTLRRQKSSQAVGGKNGGETKDEREQKELARYGDLGFQELYHKVSQERRRLLGLYAPEKKEMSGSISFEEMLMETGVEDNQTEGIEED